MRAARSAPAPSWAATGSRFEALPGKFRQLREAGVNLVVGTDAGSPSHFHVDAVWWALNTWRRLGATPPEAIASATVRTVQLLQDPTLSRIAPGARGDLLLYKGDVREGELALSRRAHRKGRGGPRSQRRVGFGRA